VSERPAVFRAWVWLANASRKAGAALGRADAFLARERWTIAAILFVLALVPRVYIATRWAHEPVWDGHYYHFGAQRIAEGHGYSDGRVTPHGEEWHPWCHYPVGYSGFLAAFYVVFGAKPLVGTLAGALVGAATVVVVHRLALAFLSYLRALVAALLCAFHPGLILYAGLIMTEPLAAFGLVLAPLIFLRYRDRPVVAAIGSGIVLGLATLVRPQNILSAPVMGLLVPWGARRSRSLAPPSAAAEKWLKRGVAGALVLGAISTVSALGVVAPWTARNCRVMDGCAFVSTNGGWNLAIGASPHATGRFDGISGADGCREVTGQVQQDECWYERAREWIEADPERWLSLVPKKLAFTFDHQSFAVGYFSQSDPAAWPEARKAAWRERLSITQYVLLFFAALGMVRLPRLGKFDAVRWAELIVISGLFLNGVASGERKAWPTVLAATLAGLLDIVHRTRAAIVPYGAYLLSCLIVVHSVFFGEDRFQIVVTPALCLLAAAALSKTEPAG
jgi:hypothetical protein